MLVLSRQRDESIIIDTGHDIIVVKVIGIRGDKVRIGVIAPRHVQVDRSEVRHAKLTGEPVNQVKDQG